MIRLNDIVVKFGDFTALHSINVHVKEGEFFTFLGPSGCGKTTTLRTIIENGYQFWSIDGGRSAADENGGHLKHYKDWGRFSFKVGTSSAQAMIMQGSAENDGVHLSWTQDDYSTLAGYNVYRAESETGTPVKLNSSVILPEADPTQPGRTIGSFLDTQVEGGKRYYYSFTVVPTDVGAAESKPSGQVSVVAKDVQAPQIIHTPAQAGLVGARALAKATAAEKGWYYMDWLNNDDNPTYHRRVTGPALVRSIAREGSSIVDSIVIGVGSGGTITGVGETVKAWTNDVRIVAVEPYESQALSSGLTGSHGIPDIGFGLVPGNYNSYVVDNIAAVTTADAVRAAQRVLRTDAIPASPSAGAALHAAAQLIANGKSRTALAVFSARQNIL